RVQAYADGAELVRTDPDTGKTSRARGPDAEVGRGADHDLLEIPKVQVCVPPSAFEREDRIPDGLSGAVERDVAAPARLEKGDPAPRETIPIEQDVRRVRSAPERHDRLVLEEDQGVRDLACAAPRD